MICPELPTPGSPGSMAPGARQIQSIADLGIDVDTVDMRGIPKLKYLQVIPKIRRLVRQADVVHAHFGYCGWLAKLGVWGQRPAKPIVMSFMGDDLLGSPKNAEGDLEWFSRQMVRGNKRLANRYTQVIVKSPEMAQVIAPVACHVIPNGVDTTVFQPADRTFACSQLGWDPNELHVLFPGNPDNPRKGHALAQAAVQVAERQLGRDIRLVPLWGVAPDQVATYMNACQAMLMTSLIEGSPNVVKEAMACDLPVLGVPVGDVHQLLDGVSGCVCCQRDAQEMGQHLAQTLCSRQRAGGRQVIFERQLDLASVAKRVVAIYELALAAGEIRPTSKRSIQSKTARLSTGGDKMVAGRITGAQGVSRD